MRDGGGVRRIEITGHEKPVFSGTEFGAVGAYERLHGTAFCEIDPRHPLNAGILYLDQAPRNARGFVEYQQRIPHPEAARSGARQRLPAVRRAQPRQPADHAATERRARGRASGNRRQRLPDAPRLHAGVERLAGRRAAGQRPARRAFSHHRRPHPHGARGVHRRVHRSARRQQHPGRIGRPLHRHAGLPGCR